MRRARCSFTASLHQLLKHVAQTDTVPAQSMAQQCATPATAPTAPKPQATPPHLQPSRRLQITPLPGPTCPTVQIPRPRLAHLRPRHRPPDHTATRPLVHLMWAFLRAADRTPPRTTTGCQTGAPSYRLSRRVHDECAALGALTPSGSRVWAQT